MLFSDEEVAAILLRLQHCTSMDFSLGVGGKGIGDGTRRALLMDHR
jgi:hypothetical protein